MIRTLIENVADRLRERWPDIPVVTQRRPEQDSDYLFVDVKKAEFQRCLAQRQEWLVQFDISYSLLEADRELYWLWVEEMFEAFRYLSLDEQLLRSFDHQAEISEDVCHVGFTLRASGMPTEEIREDELMSHLLQKGMIGAGTEQGRA